MYSRLIPREEVLNRPEATLELLMDLVRNEALFVFNYLLGGAARLREFAPNNITGVCYNHHSPVEPDWRRACFGDNYDKLLEIKKKYDPNSLLNCWHCVGYSGLEVPSDGDYVEPPCPLSAPESVPLDKCTSDESCVPGKYVLIITGPLVLLAIFFW